MTDRQNGMTIRLTLCERDAIGRKLYKYHFLLVAVTTSLSSTVSEILPLSSVLVRMMISSVVTMSLSCTISDILSNYFLKFRGHVTMTTPT